MIDISSLNYKTDDKKIWVNYKDTNCYAYALGLDYPEERICHNAYNVIGSIATQKYPNISEDDLDRVNPIIRLELDLDFLNLKYKEVDPNYVLSAPDTWLIAFFSCPEDERDFHFARKTNNDCWTHKQGWIYRPTPNDDCNLPMTDIELADVCGYRLEKCFRIKRKH